MSKDSERYSFIFIVYNFIKNVFLLIIIYTIFIKIYFYNEKLKKILNKKSLNLFIYLFM